MKRILFIAVSLCLALQATAQPTVRRNSKQNAKNSTAAPTGTDRASLQFPTNMEMPDDVAWRRDIYRSLDLTKDKNAALYYPVEPTNGRMNVFTYLFRLVLDGKIPAYKYNLSGIESFTAADRITKVKEDLLDKFNIYYEENNGKLTVDKSDVPSAEVKRYYIKECPYYDQRTATYHTQVTALCPVLVRNDEFGDGASYPLFWLKYDDISKYLAKAPVMASNLNNAANMTADDYFTLNKYDGTIYMTNNMQGRIMANDSTRKREQKVIETQLNEFEKGIWTTDEAKADSLKADSVANAKTPNKEKVERPKATRTSSRRSSTAKKSSNSKSSSSSTSSAPRVTVRRQRH